MNPNELGEAVTPEQDTPLVEEESTDEFADVPETEETPINQVEEQEHEETVDELKKKLATTTAQKNHFKEQADRRKSLQTSVKASMSPADLVAVMQAGVHADDMERVERFAISEGKSIREAVQDPELQAILDVRDEQRNTAVATNVENVRRGNTKVSAESLMNRATKGDIPSSDDEIEALVAAKSKRN